jgi:hypothetical protein
MKAAMERTEVLSRSHAGGDLGSEGGGEKGTVP